MERERTFRYRRILVKLSGGALAGAADFGFDKTAVDVLADDVLALARDGVEVAIMMGGGNIFRGRLADQWGIERAEADNIGMMATVVNSLILRGALTARGAAEVRVMTAIPMQAIAEPYIRLRAIHHLEKGYLVVFAAGTGQPYVTTDYPAVQRALEIRADVILAAKQGVNGVFTADPKRDPTARRFKTIRYDDVLSDGLNVLDQAAFILARDHGLPIHVFAASEPGTMHALCLGEDVGTYIGPEVSTVRE
ncbi:MAG TPA: UMP kinase [Chloroflexota bacterium]|nr:UMP kinase [Chloroflexota bacterium]